MNAEKASDSLGMLRSIMSGIILAALVGIGTAQVKNGEKLSDIRAAMMPRDEIEVRLRQMAMDLKSLEIANRADMKNIEMMCHANAIAIGELQIRIKNTVSTRTQ